MWLLCHLCSLVQAGTQNPIGQLQARLSQCLAIALSALIPLCVLESEVLLGFLIGQIEVWDISGRSISVARQGLAFKSLQSITQVFRSRSNYFADRGSWSTNALTGMSKEDQPENSQIVEVTLKSQPTARETYQFPLEVELFHRTACPVGKIPKSSVVNFNSNSCYSREGTCLKFLT